MVKFIIGVKGSGKTKRMLSMANDASKNSDGSVVYIDRDKKHIYDLDRNIRFIETGEFQMTNLKSFYGFICGVISQNYDTKEVFIDGHKLFNDAQDECLEEFLHSTKKLAEQYNVKFVISCSKSHENLPVFIQEHLIS